MTLEEIRAERARLEAQRAQMTTGQAMRATSGDDGRLSLNDVQAELEQLRQQRQQMTTRNMPRSSSPTGRRPNAQTQRPSTGYERARRREFSIRNPAGPRIAPEFNDFSSQIIANLGVADEIDSGAAYLGQGAMNLGRRALGRPIDVTAEDAARAAGDLRNEQTRGFAQENPGLNDLATVMAVPAAGGSPTATLPRMSALGAGARVTATNAPFAFARQPGELEERVPGAAAESAMAFGIGAGGQGLVNALVGRAGPSGQVVHNMDRLQIPPNMATADQSWASRFATRFASENLLAGGRTRENLRRSLEGTRDATNRTARRFGQARNMEDAGQEVQQNLRRFTTDRNIPNPRPGTPNPRQVPTREWGFASQARAVFDHALAPVASNPAQVTNTRAALGGIAQRADSPAVRDFRASPIIREFEEALDATPNPTLRDLRELRRRIREAADTPNFSGQSVDNAALQRLEGALSEDMYAAAGAGERNLRQADAFYRRGIENRNRVLAQFDPEAMRNPGRVVERIVDMMNRDHGNTRSLSTLRRSMPEAAWRDIASTIINRMGQPTPGASGTAQEIGFSVNEFARRWATTSPEARRIMFSGSSPQARQLYQDLDDLADIITRQRAIENMGTPSGRDMQNMMSFTGLAGSAAVGGAPGVAAAVTGLGALAITGEMLTNPAFVRWLTGAARARASAGAAQQSLARLSQMASRDPALMPLYTDLAQRAGGSAPGQESRSQGRRTPEMQR